MANANTIQLVITGDAKSAVNAVNEFKGKLQEVDSACPRVSQSILSIVSSAKLLLASVGGFTGMALGIIKVNSEIENFSVQLETITGSSEKAKQAMSWIEQFTAKTPFELNQVIESFVMLSSVGINAPKALESIGNAAASMNKSLLDTTTAVISMEREVLKRYGIDLRQEADKATFIWQDKTGEMVKTTVQGGQAIQRETLLQIWNERYEGGMERFQSTWTGMWSNIKDNIFKIARMIGESGIFDYLKERLKKVLDFFNEAIKTGSAKRWADSISKAVISIFNVMESLYRVIKTVIGILHEHWDVIKSVAIGIGSFVVMKYLAAIASVTKFGWAIQNLGFIVRYFAATTLPMMLNPLGLIATAIGALSFAIIKLKQDSRDAKIDIDAFKLSLAGLSEEALKAKLRTLELQTLSGTSTITGKPAGPLVNVENIKQQIEAVKEQLKIIEEQKRESQIKSPFADKETPAEDSKDALKQYEKFMDDFRARQRILSVEEDKRDLEQMKIKHERELAEFVKVAKSKDEIDMLISIQQQERAELLAKSVIDRMEKEKKHANEVALAKVQAEEAAMQSFMAIQDRLDQYKVKAGTMTEEDAIRRRYSREKDILAIRQQVLIEQMRQAESEAELIRLQEQYYSIAKEIKALDEYEVYEINELKISQMQKIIDLRAEAVELQKQKYEDIAQLAMSAINQVGGGLSGEMGMIFSGLKGFMDAQLQDNLMALGGENPYQKELDMLQEWLFARLDMLTSAYGEELALKEGFLSQQAAIEDAWRQYSMGQEAIMNQSKVDMTANAMNAIAGLFFMLGQKHKAAMVLGIAISTAAEVIRAIQATQVASMLAFASQLIPGDPTSLARAAAAKAATQAMGAATVAAIIAAGALRTASALSSGGGASFGGSGGGGYSYTQPTAPSWQKTEEEKSRSQVINVHVYGNIVDHDAFAREFVSAIQKAQSDNVR